MALRRALLLASAAALAAADPAIYGIFFNVTSMRCDVLSLDLTTGANTTVGTSGACDGLSSTYPAYSAVTPSSPRALAVAIAGATHVFRVSLADATTTPLAALPAYNDSDPFIGLTWVDSASSGGLYLLTQSSIWEVSGAAPRLLMTGLSLPGEAVVTSTNTGGTAGAGLVFVADQSGNSIFTIDLGAPSAVVKSIRSGVARPMDFAFLPASLAPAGSPLAGTFLEMADYVLYSTSGTGATSKLVPLPNGPGFPSTFGLSEDGSVWWFLDFATAYSVGLAPGAGYPVTKLGSFSLAPKRIGMPVWLDSL